MNKRWSPRLERSPVPKALAPGVLRFSAALLFAACGATDTAGSANAVAHAPSVFSAAACNKEPARTREALATGESFGELVAGAEMIDDTSLYAWGGPPASLLRISLATGQRTGRYLLRAGVERHIVGILGRAGDRVILAAVPNIETNFDPESKSEVLAVSLDDGSEQVLLTGSRSGMELPVLIDETGFYWAKGDTFSKRPLVRTDLDGKSNPREIAMLGSEANAFVQDREAIYWAERADGEAAGIRVRRWRKHGSTVETLVSGLPKMRMLQPHGDRIFFMVGEAGAACDRTLFAVGKDGTDFAAQARSPLPGSPLVHDRGFLWREFHEPDAEKPSRIWNFDRTGETATLLVGPGATRWGPALIGVAGGQFYWQNEQGIARAPLP